MVDWKPAFLEALAASGHVTDSAKAAGVDRRTAQKARQNDPEFAKAWERAQEEAGDALEDIAIERAVAGTSKMSDTLLMFLLKAAKPQKFRESRVSIPPIELNKLIETEFQRLVDEREAKTGRIN